MKTVFYLGEHHLAFLKHIAGIQGATRTDVMRRILDETMARLRYPRERD